MTELGFQRSSIRKTRQAWDCSWCTCWWNSLAERSRWNPAEELESRSNFRRRSSIRRFFLLTPVQSQLNRRVNLHRLKRFDHVAVRVRALDSIECFTVGMGSDVDHRYLGSAPKQGRRIGSVDGSG